MTANFDASVMAGNVYASIVGSTPTGGLASGDQVGAWVSTVDATHVFRQDSAVTVFQPPNIRWENDTVLTNPSIKVVAGTLEPVIVGTSTVLTTDTFHTNAAKTLAFSFLIEDASLLGNNATSYLNSAFIGNEKNNYFGTFLRNNGGTITLYVYNWDTNADVLSFTISVGTKYVLVVTHDGVNLAAWLATPSGSTSGTTASGNTDTISSIWTCCDSNSAGTEQVKARLGQITMWDVAQTGANLQNIKDYYTNKWFLGALTGTQVRGTVKIGGANGTIRGSHKILMNLDTVTRDITPDEGTLALCGYLELLKQTVDPSPQPDAIILWVRDDGSGKMELMALGPTGSPGQIFVEP
jgi:hypothetical protein